MAERLTSIILKGCEGIADWGRKCPNEMIALYRRKAELEKKQAEAILSAPDDDFYIDTYLGVHVQRKREILQEGKADG